CSPYRLEIESEGAACDEWLFLGCRLVRTRGERHAEPSLELLALWDNVGDRIEVGGTTVEATAEAVWPLRARSAPGAIELQAGTHRVKLVYRVPPRLRQLSLAAGIGPYDFDFRSPGGSYSGVVPLLTLYGSFFITETM